MLDSKFVKAYVIPIGVYLSVSIAGGYGTGREVVEFYTRHGAYGGLYGLFAATVGIALISALTFELARNLKAYDYRTFIKALIGRFWIAFEALYLCLFLMVLAVVGSAAGAMFEEHTAVPDKAGLLLMLGVVAVLIFRGRELLEKVMVYLSVLLLSAFLVYFVVVFSSDGNQIASVLQAAPLPPQFDWLSSALKFILYTSPVAVFVLFATRGIETRKQALVCGGLCGLLLMLPGILFHLSFLGSLPDVTHQKVPIHWMINKSGSNFLLPIYLLAMLGTFLGTGSGLIQALNERLDVWLAGRNGRTLSPAARSSVAIGGILISALLGQLGIITLIAKGYGTIAWGFLFVFALPVLFVSGKRLFVGKSR